MATTTNPPPPSVNIQEASGIDTESSPSRTIQILPPIPGTPSMPSSLSRSPSPRPGGGWASPGLTSHYGDAGSSSSGKSYQGVNGGVTWESARAKSEGVHGGYPSFSTQNKGFFNRHMRTLSSSLPRFNMGSEKSFAEKEKLGRGRWMPRDGSRLGRLRLMASRVSRKMRLRILAVLGVILMIILFYTTREYPLRLRFYIGIKLIETSSPTLLLAKSETSRRREEVRHYPCSKSRRWCDGVEGTPRVGN